jgi:outer membrane protein OmpA-like peptidoglycan-associated protein
MQTGKLVAFAACLSFSGTAYAQAVQPEYSADDFVKAILSGPQPCPKTSTLEQCEANPKTRRFTLARPDKPAEPRRSASFTSAPVETKARREKDKRPLVMKLFAKPQRVTSSDVLVTFATGSAEITPQGQANLKSIAVGLNKPALAELTFEVAGFTDVTGNAAFNRRLSQRRAEAVKGYLVTLNVSPSRLTTAGYGSDHLANPDEPTAEANRRVELHRLN